MFYKVASLPAMYAIYLVIVSLKMTMQPSYLSGIMVLAVALSSFTLGKYYGSCTQQDSDTLQTSGDPTKETINF